MNSLSIYFRAINENQKDEAIILIRKSSLSLENDKIELSHNQDNNSSNNNENPLEEELINKLNLYYKSSLLTALNFVDISRRLMQIIIDINEKENADNEDKVLTHSALTLWSLIIISQENIKELLVEIFNSKDDLMFQNFVLSGALICKVDELKAIFCKNLKMLINNLIKYKEFSLILYLLKLFFEKSIDISYLQKFNQKQQFFDLFHFVISVAINNYEIQNSYDFSNLAVKYSELLIKHTDNFFEEDVFIGFLKIINIIVSYDNSLKIHIGYKKNLINILIHIYTFKDINVPQIESLKLNSQISTIEKEDYILMKRNSYNSPQSSKAIFDLLINLISCEEKNFNIVFSTVLNEIPNHIETISKKNYDPNSEKRSHYNYLGINNLGCICYMNSMLQQFYNIPSFRYCLLQIQDNILPNTLNIKEYDDNVLHQLQNMFTYLELSDRNYYIPRGFCYAFKDLDVKIFL